MIRTIRVLGAALGGIIGLALATAPGPGLFSTGPYGGAYLAAWVVAWVVVGFGILPYLTVVPAIRLIRWVQELSTAEFVTAVVGLLIGLLMGLLLGLPLSALPEPWGRWLPLGVSIFLGLGMVGLTVAKRADLITAAEALGIFRRPEAEGQSRDASGEPHIVVDTSAIIDGRIAEITESGESNSTTAWSQYWRLKWIKSKHIHVVILDLQTRIETSFRLHIEVMYN